MMFSNMKKNKFLILVFVFILVSLIFIYLCKFTKNTFLFDDKYIYNLDVNYNIIQKEIDNDISKYIKDKRISMYEPKVILNPYNYSPLTAIVIFYTKEKTAIKLYINDVYVTTVESSNSHIIPIYGLREDFNNKITVIDDFENESIFYIKTDKLEHSNFYTYNSIYETDEYLFINSPSGKYAIDTEGYVSWYMNINNNEMDLSFDKKLYFIDKYYRLIETDFMGKIYKTYYTDIFYNNHKTKKLSNNNIMVINSNFVVNEINYKTGEILCSVDLAEIFKEIDNEFNMSFENNYINYFQYNEEENTLLISVRGISAIINYNLSDKDIIWILSNNDIFSDKFNRYKLNLISGDYFVGQHTPYLKNNILYVFDNNNFLFHDSDFSLAKDSSVIMYEIDGMNIREIYRYKSNYASGWYGSFYEKDDVKNINFGCVVGEEEGNYSKVIELDKNDNIITEFTTNYDDIIVYESFRNKFYNEITLNYQINIKSDTLYSNEFTNSDFISLEKKRGNIRFQKNLKNAIIDETLFDFDELGVKINDFKKIEMFFVDKNFKYYKIDYDNNKNGNNNVVYLGDYFLKMKGKYALYLKIDGKYYDTNVIYKIN